MNFNDIIKEGADITIAVKVGDLMLFADSLIQKAKDELGAATKMQEPDKLVSAKRLCEMLAIKMPTLYKWQRRGYIAPIHIGGRTLYRYSDIQKLNKGCKIEM